MNEGNGRIMQFKRFQDKVMGIGFVIMVMVFPMMTYIYTQDKEEWRNLYEKQELRIEKLEAEDKLRMAENRELKAQRDLYFAEIKHLNERITQMDERIAAIWRTLGSRTQ